MKNPRITQEEIGIIKRAQAGDKLAFNKLFKKYKSFVDHILFTYLKDMDEAKDLTNIVFLKVYDKLSLFTAYDSFGGWLRTISKNTAIDYLRQIENKATVLDTESVRLPLNVAISSTENDEVDRITYEQLLAEFENLSKTARMACKMFYNDNMTVSQISKKLNIPTGTIKSALSRTRQRLKKKLS